MCVILRATPSQQSSPTACSCVCVCVCVCRALLCFACVRSALICAAAVTLCLSMRACPAAPCTDALRFRKPCSCLRCMRCARACSGLCLCVRAPLCRALFCFASGRASAAAHPPEKVKSSTRVSDVIKGSQNKKSSTDANRQRTTNKNNCQTTSVTSIKVPQTKQQKTQKVIPRGSAERDGGLGKPKWHHCSGVGDL